MCKAFGLRKYARVPGVSRRSSRYDFSIPAQSTAVPANAAFSGAVASGTRYIPSTGSNGNFRANNVTNSIECVAIVSHNISNSESYAVAFPATNSQAEGSPIAAAAPANSPTLTLTSTAENAAKDLKNNTNIGLLMKDSSDEDDSEQIVVTTCLIEKFAEKQNAIFV